MNADITLWDCNGQPTSMIINDWLVDTQGIMTGFIERDGAVYTLQGRHVAWYHGGVLRDLQGKCLAMSDRIDDPIHPIPPERRLQPPDLPQRFYPLMHPPSPLARPAPLPQYSWSAQSPRELFQR